MKTRKRFFAALLCLCMAVTLLPTVAFAAGESGIQLGTAGLKANDEIYFGNYTESGTTYDVPWIVLNTNGFLLSKYLLGDSQFQSSGSGYYSGGTLNAYMDALYNGAGFTSQERGAIAAVASLNCADGGNASSPSVSNAHLYPLSYNEAGALSSDTRKAPHITNQSENAYFWWLRSSGGGSSSAYCVNESGGSDLAGTINSLLGVRPAFNLDLSSVLFTSAAVGGKSSGAVGAGALTSVADNAAVTEWKLTLKDGGRASFNASLNSASSGTVAAGGSVSIDYSGAATGSGEYISAMIVNSGGKALYYGNIANDSASGTQAITIPSELAAGTYTLKIFNEQKNGDYNTDYASEIKEVALAVTAPETVGATFSVGDANEPERRYDYLILSQNPNEVALVGCVHDNSVTNPDPFKIEDSVTHPDSGNVYSVVGIGKQNEVASLASAVDYKMDLVIPDSVKYIGKQVFNGASIKSVTFGTGLEEIGEEAFKFCLDLEKIDFSKCTALEKIGTGAFGSAYALKGPVVLPDSVGTFGSNPFTYVNLAGYLSIPKGAALAEARIFTFGRFDVEKDAGYLVVDAPDITLNAGDAATGRDPCGFISHTVFRSPDQIAANISVPAMNALGISMDFSGFDGSTLPGVYNIPLLGKGNTTCPEGYSASDEETKQIFKEYSIVVRRGTVTVNPSPPTVTVTPATQTVDAGSDAIITATVPARDKAAMQGKDYTLQWQKWNGAVWEDVGSPVTKPNNAEAVATYTLSNVTNADNGARFRCKAEDAYGAAISTEAIFSVHTAPPATAYTLTVNLNGGSGGTTGGDYAGNAVININAGTKFGCSFNGWTTSSGGTFANANSAATTFTMPDNATTITANWTYVPPYIPPVYSYYTMTFDTNGGSAISSVTRVEYTTINLSGYTPTREGYTFTGWYDHKDLTTKITSIWLTRNTTVYAGWEKTHVNPDTGAWANPFIDVSKSDWFYEDVALCNLLDLMKGTSDTTFSPYATTTRGMIVTILWRLEGEPEVMGACPFADVTAGSYYEKATIWAAASGIVGGYGNGDFGPEDAIIREQLAAILYRYAQFKDYDISVGGDTNILSYNDAFDISEYAIPAMQWACGAGIIQGDGENLMPKDGATRAQAAAMLVRFLNAVDK